MTCNTHIRTRVAFHVLTNTISLTHTHTNAQTPFPCFSDLLAGISWGCSLCMSFSHILPLWLWVTLIWWAERKTDRQSEREREQSGRYLVRCSQAKSGSQTTRQTAREWCQDLNFYFTPNQPSSFKHQTRINRAPVKERPRSSEESQCSLMRVPC